MQLTAKLGGVQCHGLQEEGIGDPSCTHKLAEAGVYGGHICAPLPTQSVLTRLPFCCVACIYLGHPPPRENQTKQNRTQETQLNSRVQSSLMLQKLLAFLFTHNTIHMRR